MRVVYFQRRPLPEISFSIEKAFDALRSQLPEGIRPAVAVSRFQSRGVIRRIYNMVEAAFRQGDVNHITGDIHYVSYLLRRRRTVLTIHDTVYETQSTGLKRLVVRWLWVNLPVRRAEVITTGSEFAREQVAKYAGCSPERIRVVPTCISPRFRRVDKCFDEACPNILHVGTTPNKNLDRLCAALEGVPCRLTIIGKLSEGQRRLLEASRLEFRNLVNVPEEELIGAYAAADLVAFVSTYEGFGLPIVEANTVGRAVVTSRVTSMPEVAGEAACLVDPFDVESIRAGILRVIRDNEYRESLVRNGFRNRLRFSSENASRLYVEIYRALAAPPTKKSEL